MKNALIIFVRNPEWGKVKTRLAKDTGNDKALAVYKNLLHHTHSVTAALPCDKFVYYADNITTDDLWESNIYTKKIQAGEDLGDRMMLAFFDLFQPGYSKVCIIGSDCPGLSAPLIEAAFEKLDSSDIVIGPSTDGGYYLLGLKQLIPQLFTNKKWSTGSVLADTIQDSIQLKKQCSFLPELDDIDTEADLLKYHHLEKT